MTKWHICQKINISKQLILYNMKSILAKTFEQHKHCVCEKWVLQFGSIVVGNKVHISGIYHINCQWTVFQISDMHRIDTSNSLNCTHTQSMDQIKMQSVLPRPIPQNSMESDHGCTSSIYFDNAGDNVPLTLYNVTLTSQALCLHNNRCDSSKTNSLNEVNVSSIKCR